VQERASWRWIDDTYFSSSVNDKSRQNWLLLSLAQRGATLLLLPQPAGFRLAASDIEFPAPSSVMWLQAKANRKAVLIGNLDEDGGHESSILAVLPWIGPAKIRDTECDGLGHHRICLLLHNIFFPVY
jgi:hypothetical protein